MFNDYCCVILSHFCVIFDHIFCLFCPFRPFLSTFPAPFTPSNPPLDANPRDYRAWHGLGQVYEMLRLFSYALFYYRKAVVVRPYDGRFWKAMGVCYENMKKYDSAIKCYMQAANDDIGAFGRV